MDISEVSAYSLSSPIEPSREFRFGGKTREIRKRDLVLVSVETRNGEIGWAPCGTGTFTDWKEFNEATYDDISNAINDIVSPRLAGQSINSVDDVHEIIDSVNLPRYLRWQAKSVIDIALHDVLGKRSGAPIFELLEYDTEPTTTLEVYPSSGLYLSPSECVEEARTLVEQGYDAYKYRAGLGFERDRELIGALRSALGDDIKIIVDAHAWWSLDESAYSREDILSLIEYMNEHDVYWIEEPIPSNDYKGYRWLSERTGVPLAAGENEDTAGDLVNMTELGNLGFLQGDVKRHGGYTGCRQAVEHCQHNAPCYVPHNYGTDLGVVANAHLVAAAPECDFIQYPIYESGNSIGMYPFPLASDVITTDLDIENGYLSVPSEPGLGVDINHNVLEEYAFVDGPWSADLTD